MNRAISTALMLLPVAAGWGCQPPGRAAPRQPPRRQVEVIEVHAKPFQDQVTLIGRTEPWRETTLHFEVSGTIANVSVEEGDLVQPGDPIAQLVLSDFQLAVSKAQSELDAAQAELQRLETGTRQEDLDAARADYAAAQARATFWVSELARIERLYRSKTVTDSDRDRARQQHDAAHEQQRAAKARLDRAVAGPRQEDIDAAAAKVAARQQALSIARRQLEKATLRAPFRGRIERRLVDPGAYTSVYQTLGVPVAHLVDLDQVDAVVAVPEPLRGRFSVGQTVEVVSAVDPRLQATAETLSIGRVADAAAGTYPMRARIPDPEGRFTGGMVVQVAMTIPSTAPTIRIPVTALGQAYGQSAYVYLVTPEGDRVVQRDVQTGPVVGDRVEILTGLVEGERLIVRGQRRVIPGDQVECRVTDAVSSTPVSVDVP